MADKRRIVIAGGSGFIGRALSELLSRLEFEVVVLTRGASDRCGDIRYASWDGKTVAGWTRELDGAAAIVNLSGRNINCRFTGQNRREILDSRVESTRALANAVQALAKPPAVFVQAGGIGYYSSTAERTVDEDTSAGSGFMADVCRQWEGALDAFDFHATRKVVVRIGIVLGRDGGALPVLERLTKAYLGGAAGSGQQFVSWVHIDDLLRIILAAIDSSDLRGAFNATAPNPVTNAELMRELRRVLHRPWSPPAPAPLVRLGAWLMGTEGGLALQSLRVVPKRLLDAGFAFEYGDLSTALENLYGMENRAAA